MVARRQVQKEHISLPVAVRGLKTFELANVCFGRTNDNRVLKTFVLTLN